MTPLPSWEEIEAKATSAGYSASRRHSELLRAPGKSACVSAGKNKRNTELLLWRDDFGWCPFSHQAQLHLEEKGLNYQVRKVPLTLYRTGERDKTFLADSPDGMVPALRFLSPESQQGVAVGADDVRAFIEDHCDGPPLMRCHGVNPFMVKAFLDLEDSLEKQVHALVKAAVARSEASGSDEPEEVKAMQAAEEFLLAALEDINYALGESEDGPYFFGPNFTVVDIAFAPWVDRAAALLAWLCRQPVRGGRFRCLDAWWAAMEARPAHRSLRLDDETIVRITVASQPALARTQAQSALGLAPGLLIPPMAAADEERDEQVSGAEAAQCLAACRRGVAALALRRAPQATEEALDKLLRLAAAGTLGLADAGSGEMPRTEGELPAMDDEELANAAVFVRSRLAVPRDMSAPAAAALRRSLEAIAVGLVGRAKVEKLIAKEMSSYGEKLNFHSRF